MNINFQEENLDREDGVIDFTLYLRSNKVMRIIIATKQFSLALNKDELFTF
jgi:hypothetical protein